VACDPPDTITPSHHALEPWFISTVKVLPNDDEPDEDPVEGLEEPVVLGLVVGEVGTGVGALVTDPVAEEPEEEESPEEEEVEEEDAEEELEEPDS
jgi:hypothetical protein